MTKSNPIPASETVGPWLIEASGGKPVDLAVLPGYRDRQEFVGYVYVVALGEDLVKVGKTTRPRTRISDYVSESRVSDRQVTRVWVSAGHLNYSDNEKSLIGFGREYSTVALRSEYFKGLSFQRIVRHASTLSYDPPTREALEGLTALAKRQAESLKRMMFPGLMERMERGGFPVTSQDVVGSLFGRHPDGSYSLPVTGKMNDDIASLRNVLDNAKVEDGVFVDPVLDLNWIEERAQAIRALVDDEVYKLEVYAYQNGLTHIEETYAEQCLRLGIMTEVEQGESGAAPKVIRP